MQIKKQYTFLKTLQKSLLKFFIKTLHKDTIELQP